MDNNTTTLNSTLILHMTEVIDQGGTPGRGAKQLHSCEEAAINWVRAYNDTWLDKHPSSAHMEGRLEMPVRDMVNLKECSEMGMIPSYYTFR